MSRFLTLMVLALALTTTLAEAKPKHLQVTAQVVQQSFTGDIAHPNSATSCSPVSCDATSVSGHCHYAVSNSRTVFLT